MVREPYKYVAVIIVLHGPLSGRQRAVGIAPEASGHRPPRRSFSAACARLGHLFPKIQKSRIFERFVKLLHEKVHFFIRPLYLVAILLIIAGFSLGGINKVLVIVGFVVAVIAEFLRRYRRHEKQEDKKLMLEIVVLGMGFLFILMLMWLFGEVMFSVF